MGVRVSQDYSVEMRNISKSFAGVKALKQVDFTAQKGEIHALIGENGAGKSTLMKILAGAIPRDEGSIFINGEEREINAPLDAIRLGISVIYQEFMLAPHLTVAENIFIDNIAGDSAFINWKKLKEKACIQLEKLGFGEINAGAKVASLGVAYQQVVEICKCLTRKTNILVLDEPTAVLTFSEIGKLFEILKRLKKEGVTIIYISHRLDEIFRIADRVTALKDGCNVDTLPLEGLDKNRLVTMMVGRELSQLFPERHSAIGETVLAVKHLAAGSMVKDASFYVRTGEVVGFSGLVGAGRTETMRALFGADSITSGEVVYLGKNIQFKNPRDSIRHKFGLVSEDRKKEGLLLFQSIRVNSTLTAIDKISGAGIIQQKKESRMVIDLLSSLSAKYGTINDDVKSLSGGNQQKVALAKWIFAECRCIVFDEPTRGVDVGAKIEIYNIINQLAENGVAVIIVSSEMTEIIGMCDRVYVMRQGVVTGEVQKKDFSEEILIKLAMGV
jgi:ribose transport system ATP-binding protein